MNEKTLNTRRGFEGRLLKVDILDVELASGKRSIREIIRHPGAAVVLARAADGRFVFVRQFRKAVEKTLLEAVAGTLEAGESPRECALRELREETGHEASELMALGNSFPAPGYTSEKLHIYFAQLAPGHGASSPEEDEAIDMVYVPEEEIEEMIHDGRINDAKTVVAWHLYRQRSTR